MPMGHEALGGDRMATASRKSSVASPNLPIDTQDSTRIHMKQHDAPHAWLGRTPRYVRLPTIDQSGLSTCLPSEVRSPARSIYSPLPSLYSVPCRTRNRQCCNSRSKARNASWEAHDALPRILERTVYGIPATVSHTQQNHMDTGRIHSELCTLQLFRILARNTDPPSVARCRHSQPRLRPRPADGCAEIGFRHSVATSCVPESEHCECECGWQPGWRTRLDTRRCQQTDQSLGRTCTQRAV
ncbi:hypothetical protein C8Q70DRAFT_502820 [Cubamyces menziesii]|nr:hypothetical protein C8Q70DRAFT_502820 [Cubamyces menziesii]